MNGMEGRLRDPRTVLSAKVSIGMLKKGRRSNTFKSFGQL